MRVLESERLVLKPVEESDLYSLLQIQWDKSVMNYMNFKPLSLANQREWFNSVGKNNLALSIFYKTETSIDLIGLATLNGIDSLHRRASWGMKLKPDLQGRGIGFEASVILLHYAFYHLNLVKVHGDILFENIANRKMCSKLGVTEEGILKNHYYVNGAYRDVVLVAIFKDEFYEKNSQIITSLGLFIS